VTSLAGTGPFAGTSIADLAARLRGGDSTAAELTEAALGAADDIGATLNCFVTVDHDGARRAAEQADRELAAGVDRGPLHGIPVGVKDLIDTAGLRTTRGSLFFDQYVPTTDAAVVVALRQAGAVIVGKTHTHEFAYGPTGDVAHTGPARNPHDPSRMTGGSSAGSGAAIAAGIVPAALGTDTGGSVRIPAALCGLVGLRPSQGSVPGAGVFPLSDTLDTVGPMAGSVADTVTLWAALTGRQPTTPPVAGTRVGVVRAAEVEQVVPEQAAAVRWAVAALTAVGCTVTETPLPDLADFGRVYARIQGPEARAVHADRVVRRPELFQPEVLARLAGAAEIPAWQYVAAVRDRARWRAEFAHRVGVDVLVLPTVPILAPPIGARGTALGAGWTDPTAATLAFTMAWSVLGVPAISLPVAGAGALPSAVQLVGRDGGEDELLALASAVADLG
jgi:aspartyl-tRNA(Asn)/glutamyl-tRNA(Gln) amidotransferase subunit A